MKILNPNFVAAPPAKYATFNARLTAYFTANPGVDGVTFDQIRAAFPAETASMADGDIQQVAQSAGWRTSQG